jgi:two-component system, LytTR family, sensor kinase
MVLQFFNSKRHIAIYFAMWIIPVMIHIAAYRFIFDLPWNFAIIDAFISMYLFSIMGLSLRYMTSGTAFNQNKIGGFLLKHLISMTVLVLIWVFLSDFIVMLISGRNRFPDAPEIIFFKSTEAIFYYLVLVFFFYVMNYYQEIQQKQVVEEQLKRHLREAELQVIKSQINPHFLFNSLNSIASLTTSNPALARETIVRLSDYLRYSLKVNLNEKVKLSQEIENIKRYLNIEHIRFGERMEVIFDVDENCMSVNVPVLLFMPLYENAVKHAVYESSDKIIIRTNIESDTANLYVRISNNFDPDSHPLKGEGIGIPSVISRLRLIYAADNLLRYNKGEAEFIVELIIPKTI